MKAPFANPLRQGISQIRLSERAHACQKTANAAFGAAFRITTVFRGDVQFNLEASGLSLLGTSLCLQLLASRVVHGPHRHRGSQVASPASGRAARVEVGNVYTRLPHRHASNR